MYKVFKYSLSDLSRSRWLYIYTAFYLLAGFGLLYFSNDLSKAIAGFMNVVIILCPLVAILFGTIYYYSSREFVELLLGLPLPRSSIFLGKYLGLSSSLSLSFLAGTSIPFLSYGIFISPAIWDFSILIIAGLFLNFIFSSFAFLISLLTENAIKGFGIAIFTWLFFAIIYDGLLLVSFVVFGQYPLERYALIMTFLNPIDLSRVLVMLQLDISALMGYTGAVFNKTLGTASGKVISITVLSFWVIIPVMAMMRRSSKKDF